MRSASACPTSSWFEGAACSKFGAGRKLCLGFTKGSQLVSKLSIIRPGGSGIIVLVRKRCPGRARASPVSDERFTGAARAEVWAPRTNNSRDTLSVYLREKAQTFSRFFVFWRGETHKNTCQSLQGGVDYWEMPEVRGRPGNLENGENVWITFTCPWDRI